MSGPKRNADKLNTIGVVVVGICGAVLVYVSIVALQAFYMNDTSRAPDDGGLRRSGRTAQGHKRRRDAQHHRGSRQRARRRADVSHPDRRTRWSSSSTTRRRIRRTSCRRPAASTKATIEPVVRSSQAGRRRSPAPHRRRWCRAAAAAPARARRRRQARRAGCGRLGTAMQVHAGGSAGAAGAAAPQTPTGAGARRSCGRLSVDSDATGTPHRQRARLREAVM